jgi:hypothetical protein
LEKALTELAGRSAKDVEGARVTWVAVCEQLIANKPLSAKQTADLKEAMTILGFDENELAADVRDIRADRAEAEVVAGIPAKFAELAEERVRNEKRLEELQNEYRERLLRRQQITAAEIGLGDQQQQQKNRRRRRPFLFGLPDPIQTTTPAPLKVVGVHTVYGLVMG